MAGELKMNWEKYKKYYDGLTNIEKELIASRFEEWKEGHDCAKEWGTSDNMFAFDMFKAGWIAEAIESGTVHVTTETRDSTIHESIIHMFVVSMNDMPVAVFVDETKAREFCIIMNERDEEKRKNVVITPRYYHLDEVELK